MQHESWQVQLFVDQVVDLTGIEITDCP